jgi:transcriptional regulator with XRE-family HTH domain
MSNRELLKIRKRLGLTQKQLAEKIGVRSNTIARWERGEVKISEPVSKLIHMIAQAETERQASLARR